MTHSRVLRKLNGGEHVVTAGVNRVSDPWLAEVIGRLGYDVIWYDMEHRPFGYDTIDGLARACRLTGIDLMVRVLKTGYTSPMRALEFGANGIMVPHVTSVAEAKLWVDWVRFPPLGRRGFDGAGADADYALADGPDYLRGANDRVFLALQVEDRECVECVEEVAALPGVDLLFVGPADLSLSYGVPLQFDHPMVRAAVERVSRAARAAGKWWGMPTGTPAQAQAALDLGARMITAGDDHSVLVQGFKTAFADFHEVGVRR